MIVRFLFIVFLSITATDNSNCQESKSKAAMAVSDEVRLFSESSKIAFADGLPQDISSLKPINLDSLPDKAESVSSAYKIDSSLKFVGWINDYEGIFTNAQRMHLDSIITKFENETGNEIAIVTLDTSTVSPEHFDAYILALGNHWGVGKKNLNNGIVIGISTGLRMIRICNGYGIEAKLSDAETKKIMEEIIFPDYKLGNYFEGTRKGLLTIIEKVR